jgi:metal-sulfur cluster biosynthetic enzyme
MEKELENQILESLQAVIDPELGISIVDLGLVYGVEINEFGGVTVNVTLTTPACPLTDTLEADILRVVTEITPNVDVNWVWTPMWTMDMITPSGKEQLAAVGFSF